MRIAYDYQIFWAQRYGGISRYFYELATHISKLEHADVRCSIHAPVYQNRYISRDYFELDTFGIRCDISKQLSYKLGVATNRLLSPLTLNLWSPSLVHETYYSGISVAPSSISTVLTVFDMVHELFPSFFKSSDDTATRKKRAIDRAEHIICISENTKRDLLRLLDVDEHKISVIHLGYSPSSIGKHSFEYTSRPFILFVGQRSGYKNFKGLLSALRMIPSITQNIDFVCFGGGPFTKEEYVEMDNAKLKRVSVKNIQGDDDDLVLLYRNALFLVYPSLYEGFGLPLLEAMANDCPVVSSNTSSLPEVAGDAALYFDPSSPESIADSVTTAYIDETLRLELISRGRSRVNEFSWNRCASETLSLYRRISQ